MLEEKNTQLEAKMDVLLVKPRMYPQQIQIGMELEDLQKAVGGYIEVVYPFEDLVGIIVNEEGKLIGSEPNRAIYTDKGGLSDILAGDFLVVGLSEDNFTSLSPELMKKYEERFHQPELFMPMGENVMIIPMSSEQVKKADPPTKTGSTKKLKRKMDRDCR